MAPETQAESPLNIKSQEGVFPPQGELRRLPPKTSWPRATPTDSMSITSSGDLVRSKSLMAPGRAGAPFDRE